MITQYLVKDEPLLSFKKILKKDLTFKKKPAKFYKFFHKI